jgi:hypothetical protein
LRGVINLVSISKNIKGSMNLEEVKNLSIFLNPEFWRNLYRTKIEVWYGDLIKLFKSGWLIEVKGIFYLYWILSQLRIGILELNEWNYYEVVDLI